MLENDRRPSGELRFYLSETHKRIGELSDAIEKMGYVSVYLEYVSSYRPFQIDHLKNTLLAFDKSVQHIQGTVGASKSSPRKFRPRNKLLERLWKLWQEAKGLRAPRISNFGGEYSGPFLDFCLAILGAFGSRQDPNVIGKAITKVIKRVEDPDRCQRDLSCTSCYLTNMRASSDRNSRVRILSRRF